VFPLAVNASGTVIGRERGSKDGAIKNLARKDEGCRGSERSRRALAGFEDVIISEREDPEILGCSSVGSIGESRGILLRTTRGTRRLAERIGIFG